MKVLISYAAGPGETWSGEAYEFPVVRNTQRPVLLHPREGPILLCSFTDQALGSRGSLERWRAILGGNFLSPLGVKRRVVLYNARPAQPFILCEFL